MRILHTIPSLDPSFGGPVAVLRGLSDGLGELGVEQGILTTSTGNFSKNRLLSAQFKYAEIFWVDPWIRRYSWRPFLCNEVVKHCSRFDLFHIHGFFNGISRSACSAAVQLDIPFVIEPFGTLSPYCLAKSQILKRISLVLGDRRYIELASAFRFSSEGEASRFRLSFRDVPQVARGIGLNWSEFEKLPPKGWLRTKFSLSESDLVFVFLGRLQAIKGLEVFIPAFTDWVRSRGIRAKFVVIGPDEGGFKAKLDRLVVGHDRDSIVFAGALYGQERICALVDSDIVVLPSFHENFGISAVEGMACGKPVLISDQVDIWPDVREFGLGAIASVTHDSFVAALDWFLARRESYGTIGQRGREWAKRQCDWRDISANVLSSYRNLLSP